MRSPLGITVWAIGMQLPIDLAAMFCFPTGQPGLASGTNVQCLQPPFLGKEAGSVPTGGPAIYGGGDAFSQPPRELTLCDAPVEAVPGWPPDDKIPSCCPSDCGCGCGNGGESGKEKGESGCGGGCCGCSESGGGCGCGCGGPSNAFKELMHRITRFGPRRD